MAYYGVTLIREPKCESISIATRVSLCAGNRGHVPVGADSAGLGADCLDSLND